VTTQNQLTRVILYRLRHSAYPAIVGSGLNSAILHYSANNKLIGENDLVLVDAGGEFHCYASDITRKLQIRSLHVLAKS
jgi:Xaa-Pro aminopeptidase